MKIITLTKLNKLFSNIWKYFVILQTKMYGKGQPDTLNQHILNYLL
jgi:hypothetical protein